MPLFITVTRSDHLILFVLLQHPLSNSEVDMTPLVELVANNTLICDPEKLVKGVSKAILTEPKNSSDALRLKTDGVNIQVSC